MAASDWSLSKGGKAGKGKFKGKKHINCPRQGCNHWEWADKAETDPHCPKCGAKWADLPEDLPPAQKEEQAAANNQKLEEGDKATLQTLVANLAVYNPAAANSMEAILAAEQQVPSSDENTNEERMLDKGTI